MAGIDAVDIQTGQHCHAFMHFRCIQIFWKEILNDHYDYCALH